MTNKILLKKQHEETRLIIKALLKDGSDPDGLYVIEHHLSCYHFNALEKMAVEAFKIGYEVTEPEELQLEDGSKVICCDILIKSALNIELIDYQVEQLVNMAGQLNVNYDGWGTYFTDPDAKKDEKEMIVGK